MKDGSLHTLYNYANSKKRQDVVTFVHEITDVNRKLSSEHVITESESMREDVTEQVFVKMAKIEQVLESVSLNNYLSATLLSKNIELENLKNLFKEIKSEKSDDMLINDLIN